MLENDKKGIQENETLDNAQKEVQLANLAITGKTFEALLMKKSTNKSIEEGKKDCPTRQLKQLCFILLYRHEPIFNQPFRLLNGLMTLDSNFTTWRYRHAPTSKKNAWN